MSVLMVIRSAGSSPGYQGQRVEFFSLARVPTAQGTYAYFREERRVQRLTCAFLLKEV